MKRLLVLLAVLSLSALGCEKKPDAPAGTDEKAAPAALTDEDVPVKGDFVEEAESSITAANYKSELEKLAAEIDKE
jgi:hypothetical protein